MRQPVFPTHARFHSGTPCPWGEIQGYEFIAPGIIFYTTGGHGGFLVARERYEEMPQHLRECSFTKDQWFEEDCSACAVILAFPQYFSTRQIESARDTYARYYKQETV